jgi:hypothetical protein
VYLLMLVRFQTFKKKTLICPDEISEEIFRTNCWRICFEFQVNRGLNLIAFWTTAQLVCSWYNGWYKNNFDQLILHVSHLQHFPLVKHEVVCKVRYLLEFNIYYVRNYFIYSNSLFESVEHITWLKPFLITKVKFMGGGERETELLY